MPQTAPSRCPKMPRNAPKLMPRNAPKCPAGHVPCQKTRRAHAPIAKTDAPNCPDFMCPTAPKFGVPRKTGHFWMPQNQGFLQIPSFWGINKQGKCPELPRSGQFRASRGIRGTPCFSQCIPRSRPDDNTDSTQYSPNQIYLLIVQDFISVL